ncbi:hypothetical protein MKEN_00175700 [Mycena kentingensis (nom. inval.)]|nr:hypothetical protein MKEN_00175700 [Mycena kentingensis (nom. inval.)]
MLPTLLFAAAASVLSVRAADLPAGVIATGTMGTTNPPVPTMGTAINQKSMARLLTLDSIDDWCIYAPPDPNSVIGDTETEEVAWCMKPRNNARVIPDGTITGVSFLKTPFYVQILGNGDLTALNIKRGDQGGELDPHGQFGAGNPIGGNVTTKIGGNGSEDLNIEEWMLFISYNQFCIRACINANSTFDAAHMCEHKLDVMGCEFVMPGTYKAPGTFETCDADVAYPPGWYPQPDGSFSKFEQYFTGVYTGGDGNPTAYTVGDLVTPTAPAFIPSSSNCVTVPTISNGIALADLGVTSAPNGGSAGPTGSPSSTGGAAGGGASTSGSGASAGTSSTETGAANPGARVAGTGLEFVGIAIVTLIASVSAIGLLH